MPMQHKKFPPRCTAGWEHTAEYSVFVCLLKTHSALRKLVPKGHQPRLEAQQHAPTPPTKKAPWGSSRMAAVQITASFRYRCPPGTGTPVTRHRPQTKAVRSSHGKLRTVWRYAECFPCRFRFRPWPFPSWRRRTDRHRCRPPPPGRPRRTRRRGSSCPGRPGP